MKKDILPFDCTEHFLDRLCERVKDEDQPLLLEGIQNFLKECPSPKGERYEFSVRGRIFVVVITEERCVLTTWQKELPESFVRASEGHLPIRK